MKISIITVVLNDVTGIESTLLSILNQSFKDVEYIVVDGGSTDGTLDIIKKYPVRWVSEKDNGIYYAMNKGLKMATGEFVWFLNSGDLLYEQNTIEKLIPLLEGADIVYGETVLINSRGEVLGSRNKQAPEVLTWRSFYMGMVVCHQSILVRKTITQPYNEKYRFSSDFEWVLLSLKKAGEIVNSHNILSKYLNVGTTTRNHKASLLERFRIMKRYYGLIPTVCVHIWFAWLIIKKIK